MEENLYGMSEKIFERLNFINFQKKFLNKKNSGQKIPLDYFVIEINSNDQFEFFKNLVKWLLMQCKIDTTSITNYSDPITISTNVLGILESVGFKKASEIQPIKLKGGIGGEVCEILLFLLEEIFKGKNLHFKEPNFPKNQEETTDNNAQIDEMEEEEGIVGDTESLEDLENDEGIAFKEQDPAKALIETNADATEWFKECARVANKLNLNQINDRNEWRMHIDLLKNYSKNIGIYNRRVRKNLEKTSEGVEKKKKKISTQQKMLNNALSEYFNDLKGNNEKKRESENKIKSLSGKLKDLQDEFKDINNTVDILQKKLKDQNNSANNDESLLKLKKVVDELKVELTKIDIRNGVLSNFILNKQFRDKRLKLDTVLGSNNDRMAEFMIEETMLEELA